ncbi:hypothetical protein Tco_1166203 [Tanacetum coccineum]
MTETKSDEDEIYKYKTHVRKDEDEEMLNAEVEESGKGDAEISDVAKADAEKIEEIKDDAKKAELPPTSSSLSISLGFGDQFLKLSSDTTLVSTYPSVLTVLVLVISEPVVATPIPLTPLVSPATTHLTISSVSTIPHVPHQTTAPIPTPPITTDAPTITIVVPESNALIDVQLRVAKLENDPALETSKIQKPTIDLEQESEKSASKIRKIKRELAEKQNIPKNPDNHALYHALMKALIEDENAMDKGVADTVKNHKRQHDDDDDDDDDDCWELKVFTLSTAKPKTLYCSRLQLPVLTS